MYIVSAIKESQGLTDGIYHQIAISLITTSHYVTDISLLFDMLSTHIIPTNLRWKELLLFCVEAFPQDDTNCCPLH